MARDRVLVIEDDLYVRRYLHRALTQAYYQVFMAESGEAGITLAAANQPSVILLDVMLPDLDGVVVCARLRELTSAIIIMLTAKTDLRTRVTSLNLGADDYLTKPFELAELLARMQALLRRHRADGAVSLKFADLEVDPMARVARRGNRRLSLTAREFDILVLFLRRPRQVVDRPTIFNEIWPESAEEQSNAVEVHLHNLRAKLHATGESILLHTVRGTGYVLREAMD